MIELINFTSNPELLIEKMGRLCYASELDQENSKFILNLLKNGHHSVIEHGSASFIISDVSRSLTHQLVRSRIASFSQQSQRYVSEDKFNYVTPFSLLKEPEAVLEYEKIMNNIQLCYNRLIGLKIPKEDVRYVLPNACCTKIGITMNFREFLHTIDLRVSKHAQWEIRELFVLIWKELYKIAPNIFSLTYFEFWSKDKIFKKEIFNTRII
jgi:thymidylate synthase (FAD)